MKNTIFKRMKSSLSLLMVLVLMVGVIGTGCSTGSNVVSENAGESKDDKTSNVPEVTLTLNHIASTNHPYHWGSEFLNEKLVEFSNGSMVIDIYPASQIASGAKAISAVQMGTLDIAVENPMSLGNFVPEAEVLNLPYLFDDHEQAFRLMDGEVGKKFEEAAEAKGLKVIGWWYNGYRNMSNSKRPIKTPEDLKGMKMRIAESEIFSATFEAFGAFPVVMPTSEIFTALQMGTVDAQENPQNNYINNKYYEVNRYYSFTKHVFTVEPLVMSLDRFNELTVEQQEALIKAVEASEPYQRQVANETENKQLQEVVDDPEKDVEVTVIEDLSAFRAIVAPVYDILRPTLGEYIDLVEKAKAEGK